MKLAVIGAGSTYTPELVSGLSRERARLGLTELALHDIDPERREVVGGLAKAMRTVPVVLAIAERVRELAAPDAWIVDFTNPVGIVTRALLDAGHRAIGLCNVAINFQRQIAGHLGLAPERVQVDQVGLNHLTWIRAVWVDGRDRLPEVIDGFGEHLAAEIGLPLALIEQLGAIPSYYLRYFYAEREVVREQRTTPPRAQTVMEIERGLLEMYRDPKLTDKPALLEQRGGAFYSEAAIQLVASLCDGGGDVQVVDIRNAGTLPGLAADDVVEVPARVDRDGATPLPQRPLAPELLGLVQHVAAYERLAANAAARGDRDGARLALLANPLVREYGLADALAPRLLDGAAPR